MEDLGRSPEGAHALRSKLRSAGVAALAAFFAAAVVSVVAILPSASVAAEIPATFFTVVDQEGVNDVNSDQVDLTQMGRDDSDQTMYKLFWSWDSTDMWTGTGQTGDACALFDSDGDGNVDFALCARIENPNADPTVAKLTADSPMLFACSDDKNDRCTNPTPLPVVGVTAGTIGSGGLDRTSNLITDTDPFSPDGSNYPDDSTLQVNIPKALIPGGLLVNVCSYPSAGNGGNNNPFDCIVTPGAGFLVIVKEAGNDTTTSFPFAVEPVPAGVPSTYTIVGSGSNPPIGVVAGTNVETVTETVPTGWSLSSASCKLADGTTSTGTFDNANHKVTGITIQSGLATTCTFTNVLQPVTLTVIKNVVNDNGGTATASAFTMNVTGGNPVPGSFPGAASPGTAVSIQPNATYSVTETGPSGYTQTNATDGCSSLTGIPPGGSAICTITNDDVAPQLTVIKHVINDNGGTAVASDFTLDSGGINDTPDDFAGAEAPGTTVTLDQGAYTVSETGPAGYSSSFSPDCTGTIAVGETKTCTVTNDDIAPKLTVIKHVINDNGGTAAAADFTMTVDDPGTNPASFPGAEAPGTEVTVDPGAYDVTETGPSGYAASYSPDCAGTITVGQTKTCTVTNNDVAGELIVIKHVINDNGGTATAADFTLDSGGINDTPDNFPGAEAPGTVVSVDGGAYSVTETGPSGYAASYSADCAGTIAVGQTKTCTVTNNDVAGELIVIKHVINDNGGTAVAGDFTLDSGGINDTPDDFPGAETPGTVVSVDGGAYNVTETGPSGYAASYSADCAGTIAVGQTKTCTVTNDDIAPKLTVIKHVINDNGGTAVAADITMTVDDP
ncbi:MAG TPA: hypothetical protein VFL41_13310, partial [Gaiellaceae bacterium]|nr:hypothetical protein [Gaiellaceae bacterium]